MALLNPGDQFPDLTVAEVNGDTIELPGALAGSFGVVLFYRGSWCPYCNSSSPFNGHRKASVRWALRWWLSRSTMRQPPRN
jgi:peroxiredoxin